MEFLKFTEKEIYLYKIQLNKLSIIISNRLASRTLCQVGLDLLKEDLISYLPGFFEAVHIKLQKQIDEWFSSSNSNCDLHNYSEQLTK
ncbi:hypothetical protein ABRY23_12160 [Melioribacteraceae bacterium 4301-Me]|uniref:hypothetical protein n=1 Tax=Pyranulibacter aquaticus TaxID=3163344 RepID=UPI00359A8ED1